MSRGLRVVFTARVAHSLCDDDDDDYIIVVYY